MQGGDKRVIEKNDVANNYTANNHEAGEVVNKKEISLKVNEDCGIEAETEHKYRIRKLTPRECWRLMDFTDEDFDRAKYYSEEECRTLLAKYPKHKGRRQFDVEGRIDRMSDTQLYKQAGNSICVGVLYYIFKELYETMPYLFDDLKVSSYFSGVGAFESALDRLYADINSGSIVASTCMSSEPAGGRERIVYDDYNSNVRTDQDTIGTLTLNIGKSSFRNAYKLIER